MKKVLALILALVMVFAMSTVAFADSALGDKTQPVTVSVVKEDTYSFTVAWDNPTFTYTLGEWDGDSYAEGTWDDSKNSSTITVTNNSNVGIVVSAAYVENEEIKNKTGITATLTGERQELASAFGADTAPKATFTLALTATGNVNETTTEATLGTITLTISAAAT